MLIGERVALAPLRDGDSRALFRWINDPVDVLLNAPFRRVSESEHRVWFDQIRNRADVHIFAIRLRDTEEPIGTCQLRDIDMTSRNAWLQIRIGDAGARDRGYGTEAVRLLLSHAFDDLDLHRVALEVFATNLRAIHVYERVGFKHEGVLREAVLLDGTFVDVIVMGILADEFPSRAAG